MANHGTAPDNYVTKKTWDEAVSGAAGNLPSADDKKKDAAKRKSDKGEAANNGGGDK